MIARNLLLFIIFHHGVDLISSVGANDLDENGSDEVNAPPDHEIPYSEHEDPPEPPTRPKYEAPGQWAKPKKNISLDFVPSTTYAQVRGTHTVKRAPRGQAFLDASTEEDRQNAGRLKEVVTNKKVNTIYTEEGYEDAAYDHAGHQRDADFDEKYDKKRDNEKKSWDAAGSRSSSETDDPGEDDSGEASTRNEIVKPKKLKSKKYDSKSASGKVWGERVDPVVLVKKEGLKLEKDVEREAEAAALRAETEVPENLKGLNDSESSEEENEENEENEEDETPGSQLRRSFSGSGDDTSKKPEAQALRQYKDDPDKKKYPKDQDTMPKVYPTYQEVMATTTIHPTTINHGKVFWDYYKTQKPQEPSSSESTEDTEGYRSSVEDQTTENPSVESDENIYRRKSGRSSEYSEESEELSRETNKLSPQASRYSTVTAPGAIQAILKSPQVMRAMSSPRLNSEETVKTTASGSRESATTKRPIYTVIIRAPAKQCDEESDESKLQESVSKYELLKHLTNNVNPRSVNAEVISNVSVIKPPTIPPFGQITYADYLRAYGRPAGPSDSSSSEENHPVSEENPEPPPRYYVHTNQYQIPQQNRIHPFFSWLSHLNPVGKLLPPNRMLPPSPMSRSRYAEYVGRRNGVQLPRDSRFNVYRTFQVNGGVARRFRRHSVGDNGKVFAGGEKEVTELVMGEGVTVKSRGFRIKRSDNLLNDAPIVADAQVDREIRERFPDESDVDGEEVENEDEGKVEIEVPEFDFSIGPDDIRSPEQFSEEIEGKNDTEIEKYPFYHNDLVPGNSALKYALNPQQIPRKTLGGMEFYDSRDKYLDCDDVNPDLTEVVPEEEEPRSDRGPEENLPRLNGLGDKLSCFKAKYFDKNPFDNPLFIEKRIDMPQVPNEFNLQEFKDRLNNLKSDPEALVYRRVSRRPEMMDQHPSDSKKNQFVDQSRSRANHNSAPNHRRIKKGHRGNNSVRVIEPVNSPYEKEVYEAVMGTIKNQAVHKTRVKQSIKNPRRGRKRRVQEKGKVQSLRTLRPPKHKVIPYRTDKVIYRQRPRVQSPPEAKRIRYHRAPRIQKRSVDSDQDFRTVESRNNLDFSMRSRRRAGSSRVIPTTAQTLIPITQSTPKTVWTIRDLIRFSKPRETDRYGNFRSGVTTVDPRRKEPRYRDPTEKPEELLPAADSQLADTTHTEDPGENDNLTTATYQVREEIEELTAAPEVQRLQEYLDSDLPGYNKVSSNSSESGEATTQYTADSSGEEESEEEKEESRGEQLEKPSESSVESSSEMEGNEESSEDHSNEEKNAERTSEDEEDFERFSDRPKSPAENYYDPEYADLGPRINKPAFYHPPFEAPRYERHRGKNYESLEEDKPRRKLKYIFPWDEEQEEASEESKADHRIGHYEFPWEKRERLAREREKDKMKRNSYYQRYWGDEDDNDDQSSSETGFNFAVTHPWRRWNSPYRAGDFATPFWSSEVFGEAKPVKFSSRYHSEKSGAPLAVKSVKGTREFVRNHVEGTPGGKYVPTTTVTPQIPPTTVTSIPRRAPTTPIIGATTEVKVPRYTVRPRPFRLSRNGEMMKKTQSTTPINHNSSTPRTQRRSSTRTTTTSSSTTRRSPRKQLRRSHQPLDLKKSPEENFESTTPAKRTIEHRSRVSTEEIITKTLFPKSKPMKNKADEGFSSDEDGLEKSARVQKVSIVTKKTPEHIYRTEKIDKDGVRGTFITIIPNNSTDEMPDSVSMEDPIHDMDIQRMDPEILQDERISEHFLASLLMHAPPPESDWSEGSGEIEENESNSDIEKSEVTYIKEPDQRLYSYVEDIE